MYSLPPHMHSLPAKGGHLLQPMTLRGHTIITQTLPSEILPSVSRKDWAASLPLPGCSSGRDHALTHSIDIPGACVGNTVPDAGPGPGPPLFPVLPGVGGQMLTSQTPCSQILAVIFFILKERHRSSPCSPGGPVLGDVCGCGSPRPWSGPQLCGGGGGQRAAASSDPGVGVQ